MIFSSESSFRLSYTNISMQKTCPRKFYLKYLLKAKPDSEEDQSAFFFGTVFHRYLEDTKHTPKKVVSQSKGAGFKTIDIPCYVSEEQLKVSWDAEMLEAPVSVKEWDEKKNEVTKLQIGACLQTFFTRHVKSGLICIACEVEIALKNLIAYVDVIYVDNTGGWWIGDLKTASSLNVQNLQATLHKNLQLSIYATFRNEVAEKLGLDVKKFRGVRYLSTTKSKAAVIRPFEEFVVKNMSESYDIVIPNILLVDSSELLNEQMETVEIMEKMKEEGVPASRVACNYNACFDYFRPCMFWSYCYGQKFGEDSGVKVYTTSSKYPTDLVIDEEESV